MADLENFLDSYMTEAEDPIENDMKSRHTTGSENYDKRKENVKTYENFLSILKGEKKFDGSIETPQEMRVVIDSIKKIYDEFHGKKVDKDSPTFQMKKRMVSFYERAKEVEKILKKIESGERVTEKEEDQYDTLADDVEDVLFQETFVKKMFPADKGETSSKTWAMSFQKAFPVKYTTKEGEDHYGLVRPPSGIITWEGAGLGKDGSKSDVGIKFKNDPDFSLGSKLPLNDSTYKLYRSTSDVKQALSTGRFDVKDDDKTIEKIQDLFSDMGATVNDKGYAKGVGKALKNMEFWKSIKRLF